MGILEYSYYKWGIGVEKMKKVIIIVSIVLVFLLAMAAGTSIIINKYSKTLNKEEVYFIIKGDSNLSTISSELQQKGIIRSRKFFNLYARYKGYDSKIKPGNYILEPGLKINDILLKFVGGKSDFSIVTIPEGYSIYQIASKLQSKDLVNVNKDTFVNLKLGEVDTNKLITPNSNVYYPLEGYLFPDTYYIPVNLSEQQIADMMFKQFESVFTAQDRLRAKEMGLTVDQVITIASLIEKEAANDSERKIIAGVIYNRLKRGMPLQIDASVIYAIKKGDGNIPVLSYKDLKYDSLYNTYLYNGLPPGPIACPGKPSIDAALYPQKNDYLYYVLGPHGHVFSKTYSEQEANIRKYLK